MRRPVKIMFLSGSALLLLLGMTYIDFLKFKAKRQIQYEAALKKEIPRTIPSDYLEEFVTLARFHGAELHFPPEKLQFFFSKIKDKRTTIHTVGVCNQDLRAIYMDRDNWFNSTLLGREQLAFHELGHCLLGRKHLQKSKDRLPASIMEGTLMPDHIYRHYRDEYLVELFTK